jgi:phage terminase large subunit
MAVVNTELVQLAQSMAASPTLYLKGALGASPYSKQIEIAEAARDSRRVSVVGCNGSGKDWLAARLALWWVTAHYPAKVVVTGPTYRQVDDVVFNELRSAYRTAAIPLGGRLFESPRWELDESTFIVGFSTDRPWNLQGFHSPHLMVIVTEAHAMDEDSINALYRLNPQTIILVGNPFATTGPFYASHHMNRGNWRTFNISAFDTPNLEAGHVVVPGMVTLEDVKDRAMEWGEESPMYKGAVLGEFPGELEDSLLPLWLAQESVAREVQPEGEVVVSCDVARFGRDQTVMVRKQGDVAEVILKVQGQDLMAIAGWLGRYCEDNKVDTLVIDDTGLGGGVTDRLREVGIGDTDLVAFKGGEKARASDRFANRVTESWWLVREWVMDGGKLPDDDNLIGQLTSRRYVIQSDRRLQLESKNKMARSPDEADALAMAVYGSHDTVGVGIW